MGKLAITFLNLRSVDGAMDPVVDNRSILCRQPLSSTNGLLTVTNVQAEILSLYSLSRSPRTRIVIFRG